MSITTTGGQHLVAYATLNGVAILPGPLTAITGGNVVMTELGQFSTSTLTASGSDGRTILAMTPFTLLEIVQREVGTISYGYVVNPRQDITEQDEHTVTFDLAPLTDELSRRRTRRGWIAANKLSVITSRLAALVSNWVGVFTDAGTANDITVSVTINSTALAALIDTAKKFFQYIRMGVDAVGAPTRIIEVGQFGAAPTVTLVSSDGGDGDEMSVNNQILLVGTVERLPNDVSKFFNVVTPFGGGNTSDTLVTLERLWRIINDPKYPNYGLFGNVPGSVFPEYDPNYPIADPVVGTRVATLDGHYDYPVYDAASYAQWGYYEGEFIDSTYTYADNSVANQELTEKGLYLACIGNFKRFAHPHHLFTCTAPGLRRPTRAGDLIAVDYRRVSVGEEGAVVEMHVTENLKVMSVVRAFNGDNPPVDTYTLSDLGRFDETDATGQADLSRQLVALQIKQDTSLAPMAINDTDNVDALHPMTTHVSVPKQLFRWQRCSLRVDFEPYRATSTTAVNTNGTPVISTDIEVLLPTPNNLNAQSAQIAGAFTHFHSVPVDGGSGGTALNFATSPPNLRSNGNGGAFLTDKPIQIDLTPTAHAHPVAKAGDTVAHIPPGQRIANLPAHTHPLDQRIPDGPSAPSCAVAINGQLLPSNLILLSGSRNPDGTFPSSFEIDDLSVMLNAINGDLDIVLSSNTTADNQYGVGRFKLSATWFGEFGGLTSTVLAQ